MDSKQKVLFLCTENSARSQIASALLRHVAGDRFEAYSAGLRPSAINPMTYQVMREIGIDLAGQTAKSVRDYLGKARFDFIIPVCAQTEKQCPHLFPGVNTILPWPIEDPSALEGSEEERLAKFRQARDEIARLLHEWLATNP
jgi:arsenate reductase